MAERPDDPESYALLAELRRQHHGPLAAIEDFLADSYLSFLDGVMDRAAGLLGVVIGRRPDIAWASAPWFGDERFIGAVTAAGLADATLNITDTGADLDSDEVRAHLRPWLRLIDLVVDREPDAAAMARMAILLRFCGRTQESLALCDRADAVERVMLTEVVRAGTWGHIGDRPRRAEGSLADLDLLLHLAPEVPHAGYRDGLIDLAVDGGGLPADRLERARRIQAG